MMGVFVQVNEGSKNNEKWPIGYIIQESGCWEWVGVANGGGYGTWFCGGRRQRAHRVMYERVRGPIPDNLTLDHLCRNRRCVNPDHLEAVTMRENLLRADGVVTTVNLKKETCYKGHTGGWYKMSSGERRCRDCRAERYQRTGK